MYQLSHNIDKAFEGLFNYQSVLPGAFSILRWEAIRKKPIEELLLGLNNRSHKLDIYQLNQFLAEDRIMCFWIITQNLKEMIERNGINVAKSFTLVYLPGAWALTDPP